MEIILHLSIDPFKQNKLIMISDCLIKWSENFCGRLPPISHGLALAAWNDGAKIDENCLWLNQKCVDYRQSQDPLELFVL